MYAQNIPVFELNMRFSYTFFIVENPSAALSKKRLNAFNKSSDSKTYIQDKSCLELSSVLQKCRECKCSFNNPIKHSQVLCRFHAFRRYVAVFVWIWKPGLKFWSIILIGWFFVILCHQMMMKILQFTCTCVIKWWWKYVDLTVFCGWG